MVEWNNLSLDSALKPGQKLVLMLPGKAGGKNKKALQSKKG